MHLVAGLGNPGEKYRGNRHNIGFVVLEALCRSRGLGPFSTRFRGSFLKTQLSGHDAILLKPMTYMNLSGMSVHEAMRFFKLPLENVIVVHDELDLGFGTNRIKVGGGTAGHKGLESVVKWCGSDFVRVRVGIGRPPYGNAENYVLCDFGPEERHQLPEVVDRAVAAVMHIVERGAPDAMNIFNARGPSGSAPP